EAMMTGLARDGGLYVPETVPTMTEDEIAALAGKSYEEIAFAVMKPFVADTFTDEEFKGLIAKAYAGFGHDARAPLVQLAPNHFLLELFHGPTLAFKDFAMQLIGQMMQFALARSGKRITIVGATSGDTGSAAIEAFRGLDNVDVFILFPHGRVSEVQRRQMTTPSESNVHALAVDGDFDDCQAALKDMFNDFDFRDEVHLAGVNSINWGRVLAQVVYYFSSAVSLGAPHRKVSFTVPTGNFGDIFAGYLASRMGLPVDQLVIGTNANDILHRCISANDHSLHQLVQSLSPSMDIMVSSNFERMLFDLYDRDGAAINQLMTEFKATGNLKLSDNALTKARELFTSYRLDDNEMVRVIADVWEHTEYLLDPHTAIGVEAARKTRRRQDIPMVCLATAHPAKFPEAVRKAGYPQDPPLPHHMADLFEREERYAVQDNELSAVQQFMKDNIRK
ncbi:threonine synthase, partial [Porticoccus sp.]